MSLTSINFIGLLLVGVIVVNIVPLKFRRYAVLLCNLVFYYFFGLEAFLAFILIILATYFLALFIDCFDEYAKYILWFSVLLFTSIILFGRKYGIFSGVVPAGLSFFSFAALGYLFDVYYNRIKVQHDFVNLAVFLSFFPYVCSGPIERADHIFMQIEHPKRTSYEDFGMGVSLIVFGLFKKMVVADVLGIVISNFCDAEILTDSYMLLVSSLFYPFQLYCDFSGYSDIARGAAKLLGIDILKNFNYPLTAKSIKDFWARWHISLSLWFKDYVYIPLGGNRKSYVRKYINISIVFLLSALWHGEKWGYIIWGLLFAAYEIIDDILKKKGYEGIKIGMLSRIKTYLLVSFAFIFFRAEDVSKAFAIIGRIFTSFKPCSDFGISIFRLNWLIVAILLVLLFDFLEATFCIFEKLSIHPLPRYAVAIILILYIFIFGNYGEGFNPSDFIYFKY